MKFARYLIPTLLVAAVIAVVARNNSSASAVAPTAAENCPAQPAAGTPKSNAPKSFASQPPIGTKGRCPVTDEEYTVSARTQFVAYAGRVYGFCCGDCKPDFDKNPLRYADKN